MNFITSQTEQKLRGGYYTPTDLAAFLTRWVGGCRPRTILEPSCGDGAFLTEIGSFAELRESTVVGFEINRAEARKAKQLAHDKGLTNVTIKNEDFLSWAINSIVSGRVSFDAVLGNPPFIRYQYLPEGFQKCAESIFDLLKLPFTKHTNAWVPFILASLKLLHPGGRLGMVVPAEIIHVMHAQSLRRFLGQCCRRIVIVDPAELWFSEALQGAVLLLAEKKQPGDGPTEGLGIIQVRGRSFVQEDPEELFAKPQAINGMTIKGKWTRALLSSSTLSLYDALADNPEIHQFQKIASVDVGIVTGANKFFLVDDDTIDRFGLGPWAHPMFGRSEHCKGVVYDKRQHATNVQEGNPTNFIWFKDSSVEQNSTASKYIALGEKEQLHKRYKCQVRTPWYSVPSVYSTKVAMLKRSHNIPRLIFNKLEAYTTDTAYRIRSEKIAPEKLVFCFINALTALSAELEGRHYGGGVLELVPTEIEQLYIPVPKKIRPSLSLLDRSVRQLAAYELLERQTETLLSAVGINKPDQVKLLNAWKQMRDRRQRLTPIESI